MQGSGRHSWAEPHGSVSRTDSPGRVIWMFLREKRGSHCPAPQKGQQRRTQGRKTPGLGTRRKLKPGSSWLLPAPGTDDSPKNLNRVFSLLKGESLHVSEFVILNCTLATFKYMCNLHKSELNFHQYDVYSLSIDGTGFFPGLLVPRLSDHVCHGGLLRPRILTL